MMRPTIFNLRSTTRSCVAISFMLAGATTYGAELPNCRVNITATGAQTRSSTRFSLVMDGPLKNGLVNAYAKDDPVVNTPVKLLRRVATYTPSADVKLHSSWALNPDYRFAGGRPLKVTREMVLHDGRKFELLNLQNGSVLFIDEHGDFCNEAASVSNMPIMLVGHLSKVPDDVTFERGAIDEDVAAGSLRIIYGGSTAGAMHFQEVWVQGTHIVQSQDRVFDQYATEVEIAGFKFAVTDAKSDSIKVKYDIPNQSEVPPDRVRTFPLQGNGR